MLILAEGPENREEEIPGSGPLSNATLKPLNKQCYTQTPNINYDTFGERWPKLTLVVWMLHSDLSISYIHTPSIAFRHLPPNSARTGYANEGALFISAQLSTDAVSALWKVWVLIRLWKQRSVQAHTNEARPQWVKKKKKKRVPFRLGWFRFYHSLCWCKQRGRL